MDLYNRTSDKDCDVESIMKELNILDKEITQSMIRYEKQCCAKKDLAIWTPELRQSNLLIQYWNVKIKAARKGINIKSRLKRILEKMWNSTKQKIYDHKGSMKQAFDETIKNHDIILSKTSS
jgi:hypothetical protein